MQGFTGKIRCPNAGTTDDHRFAQSKCTWTSRKNRFIREFTEKMPRPKTGTTVLCEPGLRSRNTHGHAAGAILRKNLQEKYRAPTPGQPFCAIEMHMDISQELFFGECRGKMQCPKTGTTVFRKPAQSKRTWTCHKSHIVPEFLQVKCHAPRSRRRLCASLHSRNVHGHVTRTILARFTEKMPETRWSTH